MLGHKVPSCVSLKENPLPHRLATPCRNRACSNLTLDPTGYCDIHKKQAQAQQDANRGSAAERGYDSRWRKIRAQVLREEPLCRECKRNGRITAAVDVDHIDGNVENTERSNLQPLCHSCHSRKTGRENGAFGNKKE